MKIQKDNSVKPKKGSFAENWELYVLLIIPVLLVIIFKFLPMAGLSIAFMDYKPFLGFSGSTFTGLETFKEVFTSPEFYSALKNTLLLNILDLLLGFPAPVILAIFINEIHCKWFKRTSQTILYLPHFLSWVIIGGLAYQMFTLSDGYVNNVMDSLSQINWGGFHPFGYMHRVPFLEEPNNWIASYVLIGVWQSMGWGTIIYLAAITGIDAELYEAATVDGAGRWRKIWSITLPCLKSTIVVMLIMALGRIMGSSFDRPYTLTNTKVSEVSNVIAMYVYNVGLQSSRFNLATAIGLFQSIVGVILVLLADRIAKLMGEGGIV